MDLEWEHMWSVVAALVASGNRTREGFRKTEHGVECLMRAPLDTAVLESLVADDERLAYDSTTDQLTCSHCGAVVRGPAPDTEAFLADHRAPPVAPIVIRTVFECQQSFSASSRSSG